MESKMLNEILESVIKKNPPRAVHPAFKKQAPPPKSRRNKKRLLAIIMGATLVLSALAYTYSMGSLKNTTWIGKDSDGKSVVLTFHTSDQASIRVSKTTVYCKYELDSPVLTLTYEGPFMNGLIENEEMKLTSVDGFSARLKRK